MKEVCFEIIKFEDVKNITSEEYFNGDNYAVSIFNEKYCFIKDDGEKETPAEVFDRICKNISKFEENDIENKRNIWFSLLWFGWFRPGGSVIAGIESNRKISLANCSTVPIPYDTLDSIGLANTEIMKMASRRQGVGFDLSNLRPRNSKVNNSALISDGTINWLKKYNNIANYVGQKGRIPALLASLKINHPDIEEFINSKNNIDEINNINISIQVTNDFMSCLENDEDWELKFEIESTGEIISKMVKAKELFRKLSENAQDKAEPGIQFRNLLQDGLMYTTIAKKYDDSKYLPHSSNACMPYFAKVLTPQGIKDFGEVGINNIIWSGKKWTKIINKWHTGNKQIFEYITTSGRFIGTSDHRILQDNKKICVGDAETIDLSRGPISNKDVELNIHDIMDGLVIGDGSMHKASNNLVYLNIGKDDSDYFDSEIKDLILKDRTKSFKYGWEINTTISHEELPNTFNRKIPDRFFYGDSNKVKSFLRGLFSANGSLFDIRVGLKQSSKVLIKQVQTMLSSIGIRSYITTNKAQKMKFANGEYVKKESYDINITKDINVFLNNIGFIQKYKNDKLVKIIQEKKKGNNNKISYEIIEVNDLGFHEVYDITVDDEEHVFWTEGVLVSNCSEKFMAPYSVCNLLSINMETFSINPEEYKNELTEIIPYLVRFADNVIEYELVNNLSPLEKQKWIVTRLRELGMGITNIHGWLLKQDLAYDSDEAIDKVEDFFKYYSYNVFKSSMELGEEKGNAPAWEMIENKEDFMETIYFRNIVNKFFEGDANKIKNMRNMAHMSIAPTGSLSSIFPSPCISSGVEPMMGLYYWRKTRAINKGTYQYYFMIPNRLIEYILSKIDSNSEDYNIIKNFSGSELDEDGEIGERIIKIIDKYVPKDIFKYSHEIDPMQKVKLLGKLYNWIDASISCTFNIKEDTTVDEVENLYIEAFKHGVRAISIYRDGCRPGIFIFESPSVNKNKYENKKLIIDDDERPKFIVYSKAPKRPEELVCDIHHCSIKGKPWLVFVGLFKNEPYEIFAGESEDIYLPKTCKVGKIKKSKKGRYSLFINIGKSEVEYKNLAYVLMDTEQRALTRLISLSTRHGCPLKYVQSQLKKADGGITDFCTVVSRVLGKYIRATTIIGKESICPLCGKDSMIREEGCSKCINPECNYSRCE